MRDGQDDPLIWALVVLGIMILGAAWLIQHWWLWALAILTALLIVVRGGLRVWKKRKAGE